MKRFINLYPVSKTLRFELQPQGKTSENFIASKILEEDKHRADSYKRAKELIDKYHKDFIERSLSQCKLQIENEGKLNSLEEYYFYYNIKVKTPEQSDLFDKLKQNLRKQIVASFNPTKNDVFKRMFKKELIKEDMELPT